MNKFLDQFQQTQDQVLKTTIDLVTEKECWKARAKRLAYRYSVCLDCGESVVKPINLQCVACYEKATVDRGQKEVPHE